MYPCVHQEEGSLKVEFAPESHEAGHQQLRMVLDFGAFGDVLGIEILNLLLETGKQALEIIGQVVPTEGEGLKYGYDDESDSFYLRLQQGNSLNQKSVDGLATSDEGGRITSLSAAWAQSL